MKFAFPCIFPYTYFNANQEVVEMRLFLPRPVEQVLLRLNRKGYEAYAVGGCVRDQLIGAIPKDWDVATSALPQETDVYKRQLPI